MDASKSPKQPKAHPNYRITAHMTQDCLCSLPRCAPTQVLVSPTMNRPPQDHTATSPTQVVGPPATGGLPPPLHIVAPPTLPCSSAPPPYPKAMMTSSCVATTPSHASMQ